MWTFQPRAPSHAIVSTSMRTNMDSGDDGSSLLGAQPRSGTTSTTIPLQKTAALMERTTLRHLTPEEIALNQEELTCLAEIEQLEMQETSLEYELKQDIDKSRRMIAMQTLRVLYKALLAKHRELARIKDAQIISLQRTLRSYG
jgi:hypothetical protein